MNYRTAVFVASIAVFMSTGVAAQNQSQNAAIEANPGLVGPGSPIYGLEVAYDNAAMNIGLKKAGNVALERAAEARSAMAKNNTQAAQRAANKLERIANRSDISGDTGLEQAMNIMQETIENAPNEQARQGMQTALENMQQAQQRRQNAGNRTGQQGERPSQGEQARNRSGSADNPDRQQDRDRTRDNGTESGADSSRTTGSDRAP